MSTFAPTPTAPGTPTEEPRVFTVKDVRRLLDVAWLMFNVSEQRGARQWAARVEAGEVDDDPNLTQRDKARKLASFGGDYRFVATVDRIEDISDTELMRAAGYGDEDSVSLLGYDDTPETPETPTVLQRVTVPLGPPPDRWSAFPGITSQEPSPGPGRWRRRYDSALWIRVAAGEERDTDLVVPADDTEDAEETEEGAQPTPAGGVASLPPITSHEPAPGPGRWRRRFGSTAMRRVAAGQERDTDLVVPDDDTEKGTQP